MKLLIKGSPRSVAFKLSWGLQSPGGLAKTQIAGPTTRTSDSRGLEWGLLIRISKSSQVTLMQPVGPHCVNPDPVKPDAILIILQ